MNASRRFSLKNAGRILALSFAAILLSTSGVRAASSLNLIEEKTSPKDGSHASQPINLGIKLFFDGPVAAKEVRAANKKCFTLTDSDGEEVPVEVLYTDKDPNYILVVAKPEDARVGLGSDEEYTFTVSGDLRTPDDVALGEARSITFRTRNTRTDTNVNMIMMAVMFAGMLAYSALSMRRQAKKAAAATEPETKVNPYKLAKETGKSVEEIVEQEEKRREKARRKTTPARKDAPAGKSEADEKKETDSGRTKRVSRPRPIAAAGSAYKSGRKAAAEARARAEAERRVRGITRPKGGPSGKRRKK